MWDVIVERVEDGKKIQHHENLSDCALRNFLRHYPHRDGDRLVLRNDDAFQIAELSLSVCSFGLR